MPVKDAAAVSGGLTVVLSAEGRKTISLWGVEYVIDCSHRFPWAYDGSRAEDGKTISQVGAE